MPPKLKIGEVVSFLLRIYLSCAMIATNHKSCHVIYQFFYPGVRIVGIFLKFSFMCTLTVLFSKEGDCYD